MSPAREWFSAAELADLGLPGMPATKRSVQRHLMDIDRAADAPGTRWRQRPGFGGGIEYHYSALPREAQAQLLLAQPARAAEPEPEGAEEDLAAWFARLPDSRKQAAERKFAAVGAVETMESRGVARVRAMQHVAAQLGISVSTLYSWTERVKTAPRHRWLYHLAGRHAGRTGDEADCSPDAWAFFCSDYLRLERPTLRACYRRLQRAAAEHGWTIPSERTLARRIEAIDPAARTLARDGAEALKRMYPAQERDRSVFHALEAVNADGHKWDVFVRWPDGHIGRPLMVAFQDLYSGLILSWRIDRSENKEAVRLAFGDLVERYGIPEQCYLDNGRSFASKWLTGGTPNRYRFKVKDEDPAGVMTTLGVQIHWTTPYHGQAKPIERAFRDMAGDIAKHPKFAGAYTGNTPLAKPENYASTAVPIETFIAVVAEEIEAHNDRAGRRTAVCDGRLSFRQAFAASYETALIPKASADQRRLWLMAAEAVSARRPDGAIHIEGNRYYAPFLVRHIGRKVTVRFDPQALHAGVHVYRLDGPYLGHAPCVEAVGFADADAAREHARKLGDFKRASKAVLAAEKKLSIEQFAALLPGSPEPPVPPANKLVRLVRGNTALRPEPTEYPEEEQPLDERLFLRGARRLRLVDADADEDVEAAL